MRHLVLTEYGSFVGIKSERVVVRNNDAIVFEAPLRDLRTIQIAKSGVSLSSDLVLACSERGINVTFTNFKGESVAFLSSTAQHAVVNVRKAQFLAIDRSIGKEVARETIFGKIRNQRAVLLYFGKYLKKTDAPEAFRVDGVAAELANLADLSRRVDIDSADWRSSLMGIEGRAAALYFAAWPCFGVDLSVRQGRGATDPVNSALNYGYAILQSHVWTAVTNAGLEPYAGFLHTDRPGKPSLVLDVMEEYKAWIVDRIVLKLMSKKNAGFDQGQRRSLIVGIETALSSKVPFGGKRLRVETIMQRRLYKLAGTFVLGRMNCDPLLFKW